MDLYILGWMKLAGAILVAVLGAGACSLLLSGTERAFGVEAAKEGERVITDGHLRPGHLELIRVKGFPGKGVLEVIFFPTAICEDGCGARSFRGAPTNARGEASFRVRMPGTFLDHRNHSAYFRDGERIHVEVTWEGRDHSFAAASAQPEPVLNRTHGPRRG